MPKYNNLIETATNKEIHFVLKKPLTEFELHIKDTLEYQDYLFGETLSMYKVDTKILAEIIYNSKLPDTTHWKDTELNRFILLDGRDNDVKLKDVLNKLNIESEMEIRKYREVVKKFNQTTEKYRSIYSFSRPVFDNSKLFAILCFDKGHSGLHCRGQITLYHFVDNKWQTIGDIYNCIY